MTTMERRSQERPGQEKHILSMCQASISKALSISSTNSISRLLSIHFYFVYKFLIPLDCARKLALSRSTTLASLQQSNLPNR